MELPYPCGPEMSMLGFAGSLQEGVIVNSATLSFGGTLVV
jgi:hypothetical protein